MDRNGSHELSRLPQHGLPRERGFLSGGGEMGERMRALDWDRTPLGDPRHWPRSLRTTVGILLNSKYPMFLAWGDELTFVYNDGYRPVLGEKHPAALGRPFGEVWAEIWDDIRPLVERALAGEPTWSENLRLFMERHGFPEEVYFTFSYSPVRGDDGAVEGMFCACTETTGEVIGRRRLKTLRELAAATGDARSISDVCRLAEQVLSANAADLPFSLIYLHETDGARARLAARSGCAPGERFSPDVVELAASRHRGWPHEPILAGAGVLSELDPRLGLPGGPWPEPATMAVALPLARSGREELRGYLIAGASPRLPFDEQYAQFFDLLAGGIASALANVEAYEAERRRAEALAEIDRAKTVFFSNISHEFRTPLTLMLGPLSDVLSEEDALPDAVRGQLAVVHRNALRLLKLVNSLLDFSRIEAGRIHASYAPTNLAVLTADLASNFRSACEKAGIDLRVDCSQLPEPAYVDRDLWEKIVLNLLSNAFKFTLHGAISVSLRATEAHAVLEVRDTGVGIQRHELPRLFERFYRVEGAPGRTHEGTGIGLALVRELVKLHGGHIGVESEWGRGTTMTVIIPLGHRHLPAGRLRRDAAQTPSAVGAAAYVEEALRWLPDAADTEPAELPSASTDEKAPRSRVLIADDNADMRDYLVRLLSPHWDVEAAVDGAEAIDLIRARPPDLVVTDVMMPKIDGLVLIRALRTDEATAAIPVIAVSARADDAARIEGLEAGADDYLVKPFGARELVARVSSQLALAHSARERAELLEREQTAQRSAELQKQHLQSLFMQAPAPVVILRGEDLVVELANGQACRLWGREHQDVIGKPVLDALPELRGQIFQELLERVYRSGVAHVGKETRAELDRNGDGELEAVFLNFVYTPLYAIDGTVDGVLVIAFDVTDQVAARQRMNELRRRAEEAGRAKDEFLAMLGHELRNPLAPILTSLELMSLRGSDAFERERSIIERQASQLVRLVDDLLDVSRITRGKIELKKRPVELARVVAGALEMVGPLLEQRRHRLSVDVQREGLVVLGDAGRLGQVLSNLLSNAAKYTDPDGHIAITAERDDGDIVVRVRDDGTGISPELLPRIFDTFAQQRQGVDRSEGGLGLGLTIVRSIVELHGGRVEAASEGEGRGSEFTIRLPAHSAASPAAVEACVRREGIRRSGVGGEVRRILVIDDNEDAALTMGDYVRALGHSVRVAHDGPGALRIAEEFVPDAVLLDIGLPGMDGYEVAWRLREQSGFKSLCLVAVTGYGQPSERARTQAAGFDAHLVKPVELEVLAELLERLSANGRS